MAKKKIIKLSDAQYYEYILSLKDNGAPQNADGEKIVPDKINDGN